MQARLSSPMNAHATADYRPDIDGLRAFAVAIVVLYHLFPGRVAGGFVGVDIFFVISGYLITGIIYRGVQSGHFSIADFYARRIRRIFPALGTVLLGVLVFGYLALFDNEYKQLGLHVLGGSIFSSNFILASEAGYFDNAAESKPLLHLWSLGVEEQFYIFWPLLIGATFKAHKRMLSVLWGVLLLSFVINLACIGQYPEHVFFWPFTRVWELAIGGVIAIAVQHRNASIVISQRQANALAWLGCTCCVGAGLLLDRHNDFPGAWALLPTLGAALLIYTGSLPTLPARLLSTRPIVFVGLISFPLYLWHWPVFVFTKHLVAEQLPFMAKAAVILISFLLACCTYWFIERPLRHPDQRGRKKVVGLTVAVGVIGLAGACVWQQDGLPQRGAAYLNADTGQRWPDNSERGYREATLAQTLFAGQFTKDRDFFLVPSEPSPQRVAVIGDSHANRLAVALGIDAGNENRILNLGRGTCLPLYDTELQANGKSLQCQPLMHNIIDYVASNDEVTTVLLSGYFNHYLNASHGAPLMSETDFEQALASTLKRLLEGGKQTILVADVPEINLPVAECAARTLKLKPTRESCAISVTQHRQDSAIALRVIERMKARFPKLEVIEPDRFFCDGTICDARRGGRLVYMADGDHLTLDGARQLGAWMMDTSTALSHLRARADSAIQNHSSEQR